MYRPATNVHESLVTYLLLEDYTVNVVPAFPSSQVSSINDVAFSPNGKSLAVGGFSATGTLPAPLVCILDLVNRGRKTFCNIARHQALLTVSFAPDNRTLFTGSRYGLLRAWDVTGPHPKEKLAPNGPIGEATGLALTPDAGTLVIATAGEDKVRLWDMTGKNPKVKTVLPVNARNLAMSPDGRWLATNGDSLMIWDLTTKTLKAVKSPKVRTRPIFSPDSKLLAAFDHEGQIRLWDVSTGISKERHVNASAGKGTVLELQFSPDSRTLASVQKPGIRLWDLTGNKITEKARVDLRGGSATQLYFPAGNQLWFAKTGHLGWVGLYSLDPNMKQPVVKKMFVPPSVINTLCCSSDGRHVFLNSYYQIIELQDGKQKRNWRLPGAVNHLALSSDGRYLLTGNGNGTAYILRLAPPSKVK